MRRGEVRIVEALQQPMTVGEVADAIGKSQSWTSELVSSLEDQHLIDKDDGVSLADTYEAALLAELRRTYDLEKVLVGKREEVLTLLIDEPKTVAELEQRGFAKTTVYDALNDLKEVGVVVESDDGYRVVDGTVRRFIEARQSTPFETTYRSNGEQLIKTSAEDVAGKRTAFAAFRRYGVDYHPTERYLYRGDRDLDIESVLIHAVRCAETRQQMGMCGVFYLFHQATVDPTQLWRLARQWDCVERWADLMAFLDRRDVRRPERFLPWDEFDALARDYGVSPRGKHPEEHLLDGLEAVGETLDRPVDGYLLGGANLILRDLKDTTKDIDIVLADREAFRVLVEALKELGYEERRDLEAAYDQLAPSIVMEKDGYPRWDVFVDVVANALQLTEAMQDRREEGPSVGSLNLYLLSLTDIFVFKAVTDREGDLEDAALIARRGDVDWEQVLVEVERQEERTGQYFSLAVLDTLDLLVEQYDIEVPIRDRLASYCLEQALLLSLDEPKTITDLRDELNFPDHQIYNKLRKLEDEGSIEVDRSGKLNAYNLIDRPDA